MRNTSLLFSLIILLASALPCEGTLVNQSLLKKRVSSDLDTIRSIFEVKYAPREWKEKLKSWDLDREIQLAKDKVDNHPSPSLKDCQIVIRDFFNSVSDYHVGVEYYSTESAALPFEVKSAEGRYFVCHIDRDEISKKKFPFEVGDEILTFGGEPIADVIEHLRVQEYGFNADETDLALATTTLTHRLGAKGHVVPTGHVEITGERKRDGKPLKATLEWGYVPERIRDFATLGCSCCKSDADWVADSIRAIQKGEFFQKFMQTHLWDKRISGAALEMHGHQLGARSSFVPHLGKRLWKTDSDTFFDAYIFELPDRRRVGYIRLPHYGGDEEEVEDFGTLMNFFERHTAALVIDQLNNPGGSIFYAYALASTLSKKPLPSPKHHIALTQNEVFMAQYLLPHLKKVRNDCTARETFGDTVGGYPVDYDFVKLTQQFCEHILDEWGKGKLYTDPTHMFGVDKIKPHPSYHYSKPIVLLTNELDFSCGDFFPAILQDSGRVTVLGTRTAGAGGYVLKTSFPNLSGIKGFSLTGSLAERINHEPIENIGVKPDIEYHLTTNDLQDDYADYVFAILGTLEDMLGKK